MKISAIVPAAGRGVRLINERGGETPKQYLLLGDRPILQHTLARLAGHAAIHEIILLVAADWVERVRRDIVERYGIAKVSAVLEGGAERYNSVARGLDYLADDVDLVLIHDGVRPFVSDALISAAIDAAATHGAAVAALPMSDCVKQVGEGGAIERTIDRQGLWRAQTPQVFRREILVEAVNKAESERRASYDEAHIVEAAGTTVHVVPGSPLNLKITSPDDLTLAQAILQLSGAAPGENKGQSGSKLASQPVLG